MDQTASDVNEGPSNASAVEDVGSTEPPVNESASEGKNTLDETIGVAKTDSTVQQPTEHVGPTMRRANYTHQSNYASAPRNNAYNFIWGEDINPLTFLSVDEPKSPITGVPSSSPGLERSYSLQPLKSPKTSRDQSFTGEQVGAQSEQDGVTTTQPPIVTHDMRALFAQQQREIRDSIAKQNEKVAPQVRVTPAKVTAKLAPGQSAALDVREFILERREREFDRMEREIDRRERDLERRERELERRQREFENDKGRWSANGKNIPHWQDTVDAFKNQIKADLLAERKKAAEREALFEEKVIKKVNKVLEQERQLYGVMRMSETEVNEMVENSVGYLLHNDEDIADRVRFQSLLYLTQERLASAAGLQPPSGSDSYSLSWRLALGPSVVTEDRYKKALELLKDKDLNESTKKVVECKLAMEYAVEYTSHLRKESTETSDHSFSFGRISRKDYMESVERHANQDPAGLEALKVLVDFVSPEI